MIVREFLELLKEQDPEAIMATDDAEFIDEVMDMALVDVDGEKILVIGSGDGARQWIGHMVDRTGALIKEGHRIARNMNWKK